MKRLAFALGVVGMCASAALIPATPASALETFEAKMQASDAASQARVDL